MPVEINGAKLQFILDTGVDKTILFNLSESDSLGLNNVKRVKLQGLGTGSPIEALVSNNNYFKVNNIRSYNQELYVILNDKFNLSAKMGTTIHGIIGNQLLKNVIAKINYRRKVIDFYNPKSYNKKKRRRGVTFPLQFYRNKPYIEGNVIIDSTEIPVKLLIDSGGSDALWLFEDSKPSIKPPKKYFIDILGEGLSGTIYGKRSKIESFSLGRYKIKKPTVSFLDTLSSFNARRFKQRNGSIGGNILKRFKVLLDYPNKQITLKKTASLNDGFYYNMSGMSIVYDGSRLVKEKVITENLGAYNGLEKSKSLSPIKLSMAVNYRYVFKPVFKVDKLVKESPAEKAGLRVGDKIRKINGKFSYQYTIGEITSLLQKKPNKRIKIEVIRLGVPLKFEFRLKQRI